MVLILSEEPLIPIGDNHVAVKCQHRFNAGNLSYNIRLGHQQTIKQLSNVVRALPKGTVMSRFRLLSFTDPKIMVVQHMKPG